MVFYLAHRLLQLPGSADGSPAAVAADLVEHRHRLLASEICNGLGLLGFVVFRLALAAVFAVGAVLSVVGPAAGEGSPIGPVLFLAWMLTLSIGVHRHHPSLP